MTNAHRYFTGYLFPHTRLQARLVLLCEVAIAAPFYAWQIARLPARPLQDFVPVVFITLMALVFAFKALAHLERLEREQPEPTPVMSFLLQLAVTLPLLACVTIGDLLTAYAR